MTIHHHFIYKQHPERYPQQHDFKQCGLFTIKAVIESYYPELNKRPTEYASTRLHKLIKVTLPNRLSKALNKYNILHSKGMVHKKDMQSKVNFLKKHLQEGPIAILTAHSYNKKNMFNILRTIFTQHRLSIRGYDDEKEIFYCYDSHTDLRENDLPVGNIKLNYRDLITYRDFAMRGLLPKRFIAVKGIIK